MMLNLHLEDSDKAISALTEEVSILKNLVGQEVGLRHIYSGTVHIGILEELTPDYLILNQNNGTIQLKLSNVEVVNSEELYRWKLDNYMQKSHDISAVFPLSCDPSIITGTIKKLDGVVDAEVIDTYSGEQIPEEHVSITIRYHFIDEMVVNEVEKLLKGFGSQIR